MTISLTRLHRGAKFLMRPIKTGRVARSGIGGAALPLANLGDHWAIEVDAGAMGAGCGRALLADIVRGDGEPVRVEIPQLDIETGPAGAPKVNGAGQNGALLVLDGFTPQYIIRKGWFFTVENADLPSIHLVTATVVANAGGNATVSFWPGLRTIPADNTVINITAPWIEGLIDEGGDHETGLGRAMTLDTFVIEERG